MRLDKKTARFILTVLRNPNIVEDFKEQHRIPEAQKIKDALWRLLYHLEEFSTDNRYEADWSTVADLAVHVSKRFTRSRDPRGGRRPYFDKTQDSNEEGRRRSEEDDRLTNILF